MQVRVQENPGIDLKCVRNSLDVANAEVAPLALNSGDVGAVQIAQVGERFLRQPSVLAKQSHVDGKQSKQMVVAGMRCHRSTPSGA